MDPIWALTIWRCLVDVPEGRWQWKGHLPPLDQQSTVNYLFQAGTSKCSRWNVGPCRGNWVIVAKPLSMTTVPLYKPQQTFVVLSTLRTPGLGVICDYFLSSYILALEQPEVQLFVSYPQRYFLFRNPERPKTDFYRKGRQNRRPGNSSEARGLWN